MSKLLTILILVSAVLPSWAADTDQTGPAGPAEVTTDDAGMVTIASRGGDVREVLFDLFRQSSQNFVLEPETSHLVWLSLAGVEFEEALQIVCEVAGLRYEVQNGIYYISRKRPNAPTEPTPAQPEPTQVEPETPKGMLDDSALQKRLTTRMQRTPLREVFQEFAKQTGITIEVTDRVPEYAIDAFLINTSLKYALDVVTRAAGLKYEKTDRMSIRIDLDQPGT